MMRSMRKGTLNYEEEVNVHRYTMMVRSMRTGTLHYEDKVKGHRAKCEVRSAKCRPYLVALVQDVLGGRVRRGVGRHERLLVLHRLVHRRDAGAYTHPLSAQRKHFWWATLVHFSAQCKQF